MENEKQVAGVAMLRKKLFNLQQKYTSDKNGYNKFGNYTFRNAEQMLKELKPLLNEFGLAVLFREEYLGDDYIKCIGKLIDIKSGEYIETESVVMVDRNAKGMQMPQCVGSAISYGRKYLLGGLLAVTDSSKDPDAINMHGKENRDMDKEIREGIKKCQKVSELNDLWNSLDIDLQEAYQPLFTIRKEEIVKRYKKVN